MIGTLIAAWLDVRGTPLRTFAAIAGMVAAVMAVVIVDAAGQLSRDANNEFIAWTYGRPATVRITAFIDQEFAGQSAAERPESMLARPEPGEGVSVTRRIVAMLQANGVEQVSVQSGVAIWLQDTGGLRQDSATLVSSPYPRIQVIALIAGAFPLDTAQSDALHAVISPDKALSLGLTPETAVGQVLWYATSSGFGGPPDPVTAPVHPLIVDAVAEWSPGTDAGGMLLVSDLDRPELVDSSSIQLIAHVNPADIGLVQGLVDGVAGTGDVNLTEVRVERIDRSAELAPILSQQEVTAGAVTVVALMIGGLGILGVGLASVRERARDFGLRRALGASTAKVFSGVIVQTLIEVLLAALIAVPLAALMVELFARELVLESLPLPDSTALPVSSAVRGIVAALLVGLVAALLPAFRAARASVVQALRG